MTKIRWTVPIKADLRPAYYDDFHCLAAGCKISCCKNWCVSFNKKDYLSLKRQSGSPDLAARLEHGIRRMRGKELNEDQYGEFVMSDDGICPLLRADCLCALQIEKGHQALPTVCKIFPRVERRRISGYLERSLSPACEGVLGLLWDLPDGIEFRSDPLKLEKEIVIPAADPIQIAYQNIRSLCIDLLQDRKFSLPERILLMGMALQELAGGETDFPAWVERVCAQRESGTVRGMLDMSDEGTALSMFVFSNIRVLQRQNLAGFIDFRWEILEQFSIKRSSLLNTEIRLEPYLTARQRFQERFGDREYFMENAMTALFFHLAFPDPASPEELWKSYVNFCNLYSFYRFMSVMSCREGAAGDREELFRALVFASRCLIHGGLRQTELRDEFFENDSATLAHMAILLCG